MILIAVNRTAWIFLLVTLLWSCSSKVLTPVTNYGITAVSTIQDYKKVTKQDSNKALVDLKDIMPDIKLDIRYATRNNFMNRRMYNAPKAFLSLPAANALVSVQKELKPLGLALKVYDAYRPYSVTVSFYEQAKDTVFVASAYRGSRHNRGCAVDVSLINLQTGREVPMPTSFDDFSEKAHTNYANLPANVITNREHLKKVMTKHGFDALADEWWHFDFKQWREHPLMDLSFKQLSSLKP